MSAGYTSTALVVLRAVKLHCDQMQLLFESYFFIGGYFGGV